jgi:hypothetical protein
MSVVFDGAKKKLKDDLSRKKNKREGGGSEEG